MGLFENVFRKRSKRLIQDPDFGIIEDKKRGSWEGQNLSLWGYSGIQIMIDSGPEGPSDEHRQFLQALRSNHNNVRTKIELAIKQEAAKTAYHIGSLRLTSIFLPNSPETQTWRVWYDIEGEDHYWYGAEITEWHSVLPFTED